MFCCINMKSSEIKIVNGDIYFMKFIIIYLFKSGIMLSILEQPNYGDVNLLSMRGLIDK